MPTWILFPQFRFLLRSVVFLGTVVLQTLFAPIAGNDVSFEFIEKIEAKIVSVEAIGMPVRLRIPVLDLDAPIVPVNVSPSGKLGVPDERLTVGWWGTGPKPGDRGNAVLDGHLDIGSAPGIFWTLRRLQKGDSFSVEDEFGTERRFRVQEAIVYPVNGAPMERIFGRSEERRLNIITCAGTWREEIGHYDQRLIVFSEAVD